MNEPLDIDRRNDDDLTDLWSETVWGVGLIGTVLAIVAVIAAFGP